jgi:hypothetical protein
MIVFDKVLPKVICHDQIRRSGDENSYGYLYQRFTTIFCRNDIQVLDKEKGREKIVLWLLSTPNDAVIFLFLFFLLVRHHLVQKIGE